MKPKRTTARQRIDFICGRKYLVRDQKTDGAFEIVVAKQKRSRKDKVLPGYYNFTVNIHRWYHNGKLIRSTNSNLLISIKLRIRKRLIHIMRHYLALSPKMIYLNVLSVKQK